MSKWLIEQFSSSEDSIALVYKNIAYSYKELKNKIDEIHVTTLKAINKNDVVAIIGDYSFNSIALLLALYENNNIIVPIATQVKEEIEERIDESFCSWKIDVMTLECSHIERQSTHKMIQDLQNTNTSGLVLFSSGSTGKAKAMIQNLDSLIDSYHGKRQKEMNILVFLMFDHIGGINTVFNALSIGATLILPENRDAEYICSLVSEYKIRVLPSSPTFLNLILISEAYKKFDLKSLRMITYGTEAMPESLLKRLKVAFPKVKLLQTFGTSETGIASTSSKSSESTFMKIDDPNLEYKIVNDELWLKSKTQILGYLNASMDSFTDDGWFKTGDLVEVIDDGYLKIIGRNKEMINVGGEKVLPAEVESVILEMDNVIDCMAYSEPSNITGQTVVIDVVFKEALTSREAKKLVRQFCKDKLDGYKIPSKVNIVEKTNFGERFKKIRRKS